MSDAFAGPLARRLLALLPPDAPRIRADLERLPTPVGDYLRGVLERRLARDAALPSSAWFDGEAAPVREAAEAWRAATRDTARFPAETWPDAVLEAAEAILGFLVTPAEAMTAHVFDGEEDAPLALDRVRARMAALAPYPYLREIAEGYFARKGLDAIGRDDFEALLRRIDRRMAGGYSPDEWVALLEPLFTLTRALSDDGIPTLLLRRFFVAKGADALARRLDAEAYDEDALRAVLSKTLPSSAPNADQTDGDGVRAAEAPPPEDGAPPAPAPEEPRGSTEDTSEPLEDEPLWQRLARTSEPDYVPDPSDDPEPLWKRLAPGADTAEEPSARTATASVAAEPTPAAPSTLEEERVTAPPAREPAATPPAAAAAPAAAESLLALETRVLGPSGTARRSWYVEQLTGGDEGAYRAVLEALDGAPSWTAASQIIARDVFRKHRVNIYGDAAVAFTDAVEARYTS